MRKQAANERGPVGQYSELRPSIVDARERRDADPGRGAGRRGIGTHRNLGERGLGGGGLGGQAGPFAFQRPAGRSVSAAIGTARRDASRSRSRNTTRPSRE